MKLFFQVFRDAIEYEMQKTDDAKVASITALERLKENPEYHLEEMQKAKYIRKVPDGKGGFKYIYKEKKKEKTSKELKKPQGYGKRQFQDEKERKKELNKISSELKIPQGEMFIHATGDDGILNLFDFSISNSKEKTGYLSASSVGGSSHFLEKNTPVSYLTILQASGEDVRFEASGDVGWEGGTPEKTPYDEIGLDNWELKALYIPNYDKNNVAKITDALLARDMLETERDKYLPVFSQNYDLVKRVDAAISSIYEKHENEMEYDEITRKISNGDIRVNLENSEMQKAKPTKYIRKYKGKDGKWNYVYKEEKKDSWISKLSSIFGFKDRRQVMQKVEKDYKENQIDKEYGVTWDGWKSHLAEYFTHKEKWDNFFSKKKADKKPKEDKKADKKEVSKKDKKKSPLKLSVMKLIHQLYGDIKSEQTKEEKKIDIRVAKDLNEATPENRVETGMGAVGAEKQPWGMTSSEFVKSEMKRQSERSLRVIKDIEGEIQRTERVLETIAGKSSPLYLSSQEKYKNKITNNKNFLKDYKSGKIDEKFKNNPSWQYLQDHYDAMENKGSSEAKSLKKRLNIRTNKAKKEHEKLIKKAISDGHVIPADVLKEYPSIEKEDAKKMNIPDIDYKPKTVYKEIYLSAREDKASRRNLKIQDYSKIKPKDVYLTREDLILEVPRPSYIPEMDLDSFSGFRGRKQSFDVSKLGSNEYLIVDKRYQAGLSKMGGKSREESNNVEDSKYFLMNAETLAATWDYYKKMHLAKAKEAHEKKQDAEEDYYNVRKKVAEDAGREWRYSPFKRKQFRGKRSKIDALSMSFSQAFFIQDTLNLKGSVEEIKKGELNSSVFDNYQSMLKEIGFKVNDMKIQGQMDEENETYKKGEETSYGDKKLKDDLVKDYGIKVKRQNGSEIDDNEVAKIGMLVDEIYSVFGDRKEMAEAYGLKVSYAGSKRMHASKAIGMFIDKYKVIAISDTGIEGRGFTFAHEFTHFVDSYLGKKKGYHFASDEDGSSANKIAVTFRESLNISLEVKEGMTNYFNRTCETFARAFEQYYAIKKGVQDTLYRERNQRGVYMEHGSFMNKIYPLCENFLRENDELLKALFKNKNIIIRRR